MRQFVIRTVLFLVFLELFFWIGSWVAQGTQLWGNAILAQKKGVYRVMCIGDSITFAGGKDSYPAQLEQVLNSMSGGVRYQVLNQATAGEGSSVTLRDLPQWISQYQPDMVVAMLGIMDGHPDKQDGRRSRWRVFLNGIKTYRLFLQWRETAWTAFKKKVPARKEEVVPVPKAPAAPISEYDHFKAELSKQPEDIKKLFMLTQIAEGGGRYDMAELLYELFLKRCASRVINGWVVKKYGVLLIRAKKYGKFVKVMEKIPFDAWDLEWVRGYCHSEGNMAEVQRVIERMVASGVDPLVYGYVASCYEEGGRKDLAAPYLKKVEACSVDAYSALARSNLKAVKKIVLDKGLQLVFIQYPMRDIRALQAVFADDLDRDRIIFVDNGPVFRRAVSERGYEGIFNDRANGNFGHGTREGNRILAENVARAILQRMPGKGRPAPAR
jgi:hypothetical protein